MSFTDDLTPLVIGAGPAGRAAATALAGLGFSPVLVDRRADVLAAMAPIAGVSPLEAEAFHVEPGLVWLRTGDDVRTQPFSHLVIATGMAQTQLPDASGSWGDAGFLPEARLAAVAGCAFRFDAGVGWIVPETDAGCRSSKPDIFVVGGARGLTAQADAARDGEICAASIAGVPPRAERSLPGSSAYRGTLPPDLAPDAVLCPCTQATLADLRDAVAAGIDDTYLLGRFSSAGEGECRGRRCALAVGLALAAETGRTLAQVLAPPVEFPAAAIPIAAFVTITPERPEAAALTQDHGGLR